MGQRAHIITKYEIEYGSEGVSGEIELFGDILGYFCQNAWTGTDYYDSDITWEIPRDEFEKMIPQLKTMSEEEFKEEFDPDKYITKKEIEDFVEKALEQTPKDSPYVRFHWF